MLLRVSSSSLLEYAWCIFPFPVQVSAAGAPFLSDCCLSLYAYMCVFFLNARTDRTCRFDLNHKYGTDLRDVNFEFKNKSWNSGHAFTSSFFFAINKLSLSSILAETNFWNSSSESIHQQDHSSWRLPTFHIQPREGYFFLIDGRYESMSHTVLANFRISEIFSIGTCHTLMSHPFIC